MLDRFRMAVDMKLYFKYMPHIWHGKSGGGLMNQSRAFKPIDHAHHGHKSTLLFLWTETRMP